jgi:hypothetical protein
MTYEDHLLSREPYLILSMAKVVSDEIDIPMPQQWFTAAKNNVNKLESNGKVWPLIIDLMRSEKPSLGIEFLRVIGALKIILPELDDCYGVEQNP